MYMANSYLNIITFLLTTAFYYLAMKPSLTYSVFSHPDERKTYMSNHYKYLAIYVLLVILIQFAVNSSILTNKCGGNIGDNMGAAGVLTIIPWCLIFGALVLILTAFPGFKSAFADVIGYYYVSSSANELLTELLMNQEIEQKLKDDPNMTQEKREAMETAADTILKICGNTSILINQMVPNNFDNYWKILTPIMKQKYQENTPDTEKMKEDLFRLVVARDNVGESLWYIYTGILLTAIVQLKITSRGCSSNPKTMEAKYKQFLEDQEKAQVEKEKVATTYTISG